MATSQFVYKQLKDAPRDPREQQMASDEVKIPIDSRSNTEPLLGETSSLATLKKLIDESKFIELSHILKTQYKQLSETQQKELLDYYVNKNKTKHNIAIAHAIAGYFGEFFYLYWDLVGRLEICPKLFPGVDKSLVEIVNYAATPFIGVANVTYNPKAEADGYMEKVMLNPKASLGNVVKDNSALALAFTLYSFGGGYVEVEQLDDWLETNMGYAKYIPIALLIYTAVCYYVAFNFDDTIEGIAKWKKHDSLLKKAFSCRNGEELGERITALFAGMHEFSAFVERVIRISYGGFVAGMQTSKGNEFVAYPIATVIGLGTMPVALGTRCMKIRDSYYPDGFESSKSPQYLQAKARYEAQYQGLCGKLKREAFLFLTPSLFLNVPLSLSAYRWGSGLISDNSVSWMSPKALGGMVAGATSLMTHIITRLPAKRKEIVAKALAEGKGVLSINLAGKGLAFFSNVLDQTSRTLTLGYILENMFPKTFSSTDDSGQMNLFYALMIQAFIASAAFRYQNAKGAKALHSMFPCAFKKDEPPLIGLPEESGTPIRRPGSPGGPTT